MPRSSWEDFLCKCFPWIDQLPPNPFVTLCSQGSVPLIPLSSASSSKDKGEKHAAIVKLSRITVCCNAVLGGGETACSSF
eukprot:5593213-Amphidinium_carterae.2